MRAFVAVFVFVAASIFGSGETRAKSVEAFTSDVWTGFARYDETGTFLGCTMEADYESGTTLVFSIDRKMRLDLALFNKAWELEVGRKYPVTLRVDRFPAEENELVARGKQNGSIYIYDSAGFYDRFMRGRALTIHTETTLLKYDLSGTMKALPKLRTCAAEAALREKMAQDERRNPFAVGTTTAKPSSKPRDFSSVKARRDISRDFVDWMIEDGGFDDYFRVSRDQLPEALESQDEVIANGTVIITMVALNGLANVSKDELISVIANGDRKECRGGSFVSNSEDLALSEEWDSFVVRNFCKAEDEENDFSNIYVFLKIGKDGVARFMISGTDEPEMFAAEKKLVGLLR